ncbi:MAG: HD domain-containing phosphohydrolase [Vicinamibacterales bacterium]
MTTKQQAGRLAPHLVAALVIAAAAPAAAVIAGPSRLGSLAIVVSLAVLSYVTFRSSAGRMDDANRHLSELNDLFFSTVETLAAAIDAKDQIAHGHIRRVQHYAVRLARALGMTSESDLKAIEAAALLHDMGKLSVPEFILNKPGRLTAGEYERIKLHAEIGATILSQIKFPYPVVPIVRHHHENWDGTGYPDGMAGENIPIGARILAVVDCYDALTSDRPYRLALSSEQALRIIVERRGTMYDPRVVDAFLEVNREPATIKTGSEDRTLLELVNQVRAPLPPEPSKASAARLPDAPQAAEALLRLCETARWLTGHGNRDDIGQLLGRQILRLTSASLVIFFAVEEEAGQLVAACAYGCEGERVEGMRIPLGQRLSGWVAANRRSVLNSSASLDLADVPKDRSRPLEGALAVPLVDRGELTGVLALYAAAGTAFTDDDRRVAELAAPAIAAALSAAMRSERIRSPLRDSVTGLPNEQSLRQLLAAGSLLEGPAPIAVGVVSLGAAGAGFDADLLRSLADSARKRLRTTDLVFRVGESELALLMPDTGPDAARQAAARIAASITEDAWARSVPAVRLGLAFAPADGRTLDELLTAARSRRDACPAGLSLDLAAARTVGVH